MVAFENWILRRNGWLLIMRAEFDLMYTIGP
jgi:hypothetical protein